MRISLLLGREPFGRILESSLGRFLENRDRQKYQVEWREERPPMLGGVAGVWLCNPYLNVLFPRSAKRALLAPALREFSRSTVAWRRLVQAAYCRAATSTLGAPCLARAWLAIRPAPPDWDRMVFLGGNAKIRILMCLDGTSFGILKAGFPDRFMKAEIETRRMAERLGLPVPSLLEVAADGSYFKEECVVGTPVNRLAERGTAEKATSVALGAMRTLAMASLEIEATADYVDARLGECHRLLESCRHANAFGTEARQALEAVARCVKASAEGVDRSVGTCVTHGDFQPANILWDGKRTWLIDWEYSGIRQAVHDVLVLGLGSRFPAGLAARTREFVARGVPGSLRESAGGWPGADWGDHRWRKFCAAAFLMDEFLIHLRENDNELFRAPTDGLRRMSRELVSFAS